MSSFPILGDADYLGYLASIDHRGANASTHIADIRYPVQRAPVRSVVKLLPPSGLQACNEAISWLVLRAIGVPSPRMAALLVLSEKKAKAVLGARIVSNEFVQDGHVMAWAAQWQDSRSIRALFAGSVADDKWLSVLKTEVGSQLAAFDEWLHNRDRNTGNVLYAGDGSCIAIDHEQVFNFQNWHAADLQHAAEYGDSLRILDRAQRGNKLKPEEWRYITNAMIHHSQAHSEALNVCRQQVEELLLKVYQAEFGAKFAERIFKFISVRCSDQWMQQRVGALA